MPAEQCREEEVTTPSATEGTSSDITCGGEDRGNSSRQGPPVLDVIVELERWLPPCVQQAPVEEKIKYLESVLLLYKQREETRLTVHQGYQRTVQVNYKPQYPELQFFNAQLLLASSFLTAMQTGTKEAFDSVVQHEGNGVYSFDLLRVEACNMLLDEVKHFEAWLGEVQLKKFRPNSMNRHGAVLDDMGLQPMLSELVQRAVSPLASGELPVSPTATGRGSAKPGT